jgi:hypothetical protein
LQVPYVVSGGRREEERGRKRGIRGRGKEGEVGEK